MTAIAQSIPYQLSSTISADVHAAAHKIIEHTLGFSPTLSYFDLIENPYTDHSPLTCYVDTHGNTYWLDYDRRLVIKMDPDPRPFAPTRQIAAENYRTIAELRDQAISIANRAIPNFSKQIHRYHPFEQRLNREHVVFRWEATSPLNNEHVPTLYLNLWANGQIKAYSNTLSYWI